MPGTPLTSEFGDLVEARREEDRQDELNDLRSSDTPHTTAVVFVLGH